MCVFGVLTACLTCSCTIAPAGYQQIGHHIVVAGERDNASVVMIKRYAESMFYSSTNDTVSPSSITQLDKRFVGLNGVSSVEVKPGEHMVFLAFRDSNWNKSWAVVSFLAGAGQVWVAEASGGMGYVRPISGASYEANTRCILYQGRRLKIGSESEK